MRQAECNRKKEKVLSLVPAFPKNSPQRRNEGKRERTFGVLLDEVEN
jgi:hypothetical protein